MLTSRDNEDSTKPIYQPVNLRLRYHIQMLGVPRWLLLTSALFCGAAYFTVRFPDVPGFSVGSYVATVLTALPALVALWCFLGPRRAGVSLLELALFGFAIEITGTVTGFPYGEFYYGESLGVKIGGVVPLLLPVSYVPLVIGATAAAFPAGFRPGSLTRFGVLAWIVRSAILLTLIDGVLDPGAAALGFWVWPDGGAYYGVPLSNYLGWILSSVLACGLLVYAGRWDRAGSPPLPGLVDSAVIAVAFWVGVCIFSGLYFPALLGTLLYAYLLYRRSRLRSKLRSGYKLT